MINQLIQSLRSSENFKNKFKSNDISYVLLTSGGYRKYDKGRVVVIIFDGSEPKLVVKFYKNSDSISNEFEIQTQIYEIYDNLITKPLSIEHFGDYKLFVEEPVLGKNLTRYVYENLNQNSLLEIFKLIFAFYENLNFHVEPSNIENFTKEIDLIFQTFNSNFKISNSHTDMIEHLKLKFLEKFENKKIYQRFTNGDFILNNFIVNDNKITLTDFEFSKKTHLYFLEWFQFFRYQWIISNDYVHDMTQSEIIDPFYDLGLKEFSNYKTNDKFTLACRLIFEISDFVKRINISSPSTCKTLIHDMEKFINELNSRYNNPNIAQKKSNLESSEKEFFKEEYDKLIQYTKNTDELISLRKSNDEYKLKLQNIFEELDKIRRGFNEQKYLNEYLSKDNDELRKEVKRIILDHENFKITAKTDHENFKITAKTDHENYKQSIETSMIWKFARFLDKLTGKKDS